MSTVPPDGVTNAPRRRFTRAEYEQMVAAGIFKEDERIELVFGDLVEMSPIDPSHAEATGLLAEQLRDALKGRARVRSQVPLAATEDSEPEPDVIVTPLGDYWRQHASKAHLVVEVARTSLAYDRGEKALLYGLSEVDEYWIVNLVSGVVEVRRERERGVWGSVTLYRRGQQIALLAFPDVIIDVAQFLPTS